VQSRRASQTLSGEKRSTAPAERRSNEQGVQHQPLVRSAKDRKVNIRKADRRTQLRDTDATNAHAPPSKKMCSQVPRIQPSTKLPQNILFGSAMSIIIVAVSFTPSAMTSSQSFCSQWTTQARIRNVMYQIRLHPLIEKPRRSHTSRSTWKLSVKWIAVQTIPIL
jgi:hypothetical protein